MIGFSLNPIEYITRVWGTVKLGRILVLSCITVTVLAVFIGFSIRLNGFGLATIWVIPIGFWIWLAILANTLRLEVIWQGSTGFPAREEHGDHPIHAGGYFHVVAITARNIGLEKLSLEPRMVLSDVKTDERILEMKQMEVCPLSMQKADIILASNPMTGERPPHCPSRINLNVDDVVNYHLEFLVDKIFVDRIGFSKVVQASFSLKFIDTLHGIFEFKIKHNKKGRAIIECKRSRAK